MLQRRMRNALFLTLVVMLPLAGPNSAYALQEVTGAMAYAGDATYDQTVGHSRITFSTGEDMNFAMFLNADGLGWSSVTIGVHIFDQSGKLRHSGSTAFSGSINEFIWRMVVTVNAGTLPAGSYRWLMAVIGNNGTTFVSSYQPLVIQ